MNRRLNNRGYMLIEIILAFVIAMGIAYFMFELIIKIKNKNDDLLVKTLVATDQTIIYNKIMEEIHQNGGDSFNCSNLKLNGKTLYYDKNGNDAIDNGEIIDIISDYSDVRISSCSKEINEKNNEIIIKIPLEVKQLSENYDVEINYQYELNKFQIIYNANGGYHTTKLFTTVEESIYTVPEDSKYQLEVWGAQGGDAKNYRGGYGGYSVGTVSLSAGTKLYVNVGGRGTSGHPTEERTGGYNGGGSVPLPKSVKTNRIVASGGGATHIATKSGKLSDLSSNETSVLIVAGGGGGGYCHDEGSQYCGIGGDAGGYEGMNGAGKGFYGLGGTQNVAGTANGNTSAGVGDFGKGGSVGIDAHGSGGGGGYYGGGGSSGTSGTANSSGGGGSGHIGNSLLSNKAMYCYNCKTSNEANTLTKSTNNVSHSLSSKYAKSLDGAARINKITVSKIHTYGEKYGTLPTPTRNGYTFKGWNTKADGTGTTITSSSIVNVTSNQELYAIWELNTLWLYQNGEQYISTTGGWSAVSHGHTDNYWRDATVTFEKTNVKLEAKRDPTDNVTIYGLNQFGGAMTENKIDITNYSKLYVNVSERTYTDTTSNEYIYGALALYTERKAGDTNRPHYIHLEKISAGLYYLDVSSVTGSYYVGVEVGCEGSTRNPLFSNMKFTAVYLK